MRFGLLGRLEVVDDDGRSLDLGGAQPRALLGMLLVAAGRVVSAEAVIEALWGEASPPSAAGTLQSYVSRLRRALEPDRARGAEATVLVWDPPGYRLAVEADSVDAWRFERLADEGRAFLDAGRDEEASATLAGADALWRGPALLELRDHDFAAGVAARLEERRLAVIEDRFEADLRLGRHAAAVGGLTEAVAVHPLREGLRSQLALALYRSGRQADALRAIEDARRTLREELGIDPGRPLRDLEVAILDHDPAIDAQSPRVPGAPAAPRPAAPTARQRPAPAVPSVPTLVGRGSELARLRAALTEATAGSGPRFVAVEGEPGIGKTRLAEELAGEAERAGATVVWGRCYEGGAAPAFWPWLAALRSLVEISGTSAPDLDQLLAPTSDAHLFPSGSGRFGLFEAVAAALVDAAGDAPAVVVLDDIQWADQASLELLGFLAGALVEGRILVVATVRELDVGRADALVEALAALARRPGSRRLHLRGLGRDDTAELLAAAVVGAVDPTVATTIHVRAGGNPFYATELARLLVDGGDLAPTGAIAAGAIPAGVRDVVRQRLARLPQATTELLRVASVIGRDAELGLLTRAADRDIDACLDDLDPAIVQRLVEAVAGQPGTFRFVHALVREVLVEDLSSLRRARLHLRVADAIEGQAGEAADAAEILAEHLWAAAPIGVGRRAAGALERAAEVAIRRLAYEAGQDLLERAVQLHRSVGGSSVEEQTDELTALTRLLAVRRALHGYHAILDETSIMGRTRELAERINRQDVLVRLLWAEWAGLDTACDLAHSAPIAEEIRRLARASDDRVTQVMGLQAWGIHCWHLGRITEASENLDAASALTYQADSEGLAMGFEQEQELLPQPFALYVHVLVGDLDDAAERFATLAAGQDHPFATAVVQMFASAGALAIGDSALAAAEARKGLEGDPDLAFTFWGCGTQCYLGCALALLGDVDDGVAMVRAALPRFLESGARTGVPLFHARLAQALGRAGRFDEAKESLRDAEDSLKAYTEAWAAPVVLAVDAELRHHQGATAVEVRSLLREAAARATDQGAHAVAAGIVATATELGIELG